MNRSARANAHTNTQRDNLLNQIGMETAMPIRKENRSKKVQQQQHQQKKVRENSTSTQNKYYAK